jgi:hypothetical protein
MKITILLLISLTFALTYKLSDEKGQYTITTAHGIILGGKLTNIYKEIRVIDNCYYRQSTLYLDIGYKYLHVFKPDTNDLPEFSECIILDNEELTGYEYCQSDSEDTDTHQYDYRYLTSEGRLVIRREDKYGFTDVNSSLKLEQKDGSWIYMISDKCVVHIPKKGLLSKWTEWMWDRDS